jgi:6-pyruvoyltetrahydropterin/6-carboxytetrahydropterin synthase
MMATLSKRFTFDAAHCLPKLPDGHKCKRLHGHTYEVELVCRGQVDKETGFVIDYDAIALAWQPFHDRFDHRYLNEIHGLETPSTENLVAWIFSEMYVNQDGVFFKAVWPVLDRIRIKESSTTWCEMTKSEWLAFCGPHA